MRLTCAISAAFMLFSSFVAASDNAEFNSASIQAMERPNVAFYKNRGDGDYYEEDYKDKFKHKHDDGAAIVIIDQKTATVTAPGSTVTVPGSTVTAPGSVTSVTSTVTVPSEPIPNCFEAISGDTPQAMRGAVYTYAQCISQCPSGTTTAGLQYRVRVGNNDVYACYCYSATDTLPNIPSDRCHVFQGEGPDRLLYYYGETVNEIYLFSAVNPPNGIATPVAPP